MSKKSAKKPPKVDNSVRDALAEAARDADVCRLQCDKIAAALLKAEGAQEKLAGIFFKDFDGTAQQGFDADYKGVKTAYEKLGK